MISAVQMFDHSGYQNTGVTAEMQNYLASVQDNKELISGDYVTNSLNANFIEMLKHLYPGEEERFKVLNSGTYVAGLVDDKIGSYVGTPEEGLDYRVDYDKLVETILTTGYAMLKVFSTKGEGWRVEAVDGQKYYFDGVTEFFVEQYEISETDPTSGVLAQKKNYLYVQTFSNNLLKNSLFEIQKNVLSYGKPVPLATVSELKDRPDEQIITETNRLVYVSKVEYSLINKIKSIVYSIERKWMEADKQFQNYMEQFMVFENIEIPQTATKTVEQDGIQYKVTDFNQLGKVVETNQDNGGGTIHIVKNGNDLIKEALEFSERQLRSISAITDIPPIFLGLDSAQGNDSGTSIVKSSGAFYKRVERYRTAIQNVFWDVSKAITTFKQLEFVWPSIVSSDPAETLDSEIKKLDAGITSKKRAIMNVEGVSEEEAAKIIEEIAAESKLAVADASAVPGTSDTQNT